MTKTEEKAPKEKSPQEFADKYQALCQEYGYQVVVVPTWVGRDDGTFSTRLQTSVGKLPKQE